MPVDFPCWDRVCAFFRRWRESGLTAEFHDRLRGEVPEPGNVFVMFFETPIHE